MGGVSTVLALAGGGYAVMAAVMAERFLRRAPPISSASPAVSILKPLYGDSPGLFAALEGFCTQDYAAEMQVLFGVQDSDDPAVAVVRALQAKYPRRDLELVVDARVYGANRKISNLMNLAAAARHPIVVLSDADIEVAPDYLRRVTGALSQPGVGAVTCLYVGEARGGAWSSQAAMAINYHFLLNAIVGKGLGLARPCFGSTIALTQETLARIGGFGAFRDRLADDYEIGRAIRALGLSVAIPPMTVVHLCGERTLRDMIGHELRWARTVRLIDPAGFAGSVVTHAAPIALLAALLLGFPPLSLVLILAILGVRIAAKFAIDAATDARAGPWWLLPARDVLSFGVFLASFAGSSVEWQGRRFRVSREGVLTPR